MPDPFALKTADPTFDPREPVMVNGYRYVPNKDGAEIWAAIEMLTESEGNSVTVLCPNPDFNGQPNYAIECCGDWTNWQDRRFAHDNRAECFRLALAALNRARQEAKAAVL